MQIHSIEGEDEEVVEERRQEEKQGCGEMREIWKSNSLLNLTSKAHSLLSPA